MKTNKGCVFVGLSGGVDSSVAAYLLKQQGYEVQGLFMKNWEEDDTDEYCSASADIADAEAVCDKLKIPLHKMNFAHEYWENVFAHFLTSLKKGYTPNPDILCNREIKFKAFLEQAMRLGADCIATGHYARRQDTAAGIQLLKGMDIRKDQSYFLYALTQKPLRKSLFPLGDLEKMQVRKIAKELGLINHAKKDSTGICFIGERRFKTFLQDYLPAQPGNIKSLSGEILGQHDGLMYYTIGQRQGLNIGGRRDGNGDAWYVAAKDLTTNTLIAVQGANHEMLLSDSLVAGELTWTLDAAPQLPLQCSAKTRYRQACQACTVYPRSESEVLVRFAEPQRAITPGQSVVFYANQLCLGGGIIVEKSQAKA